MIGVEVDGVGSDIVAEVCQIRKTGTHKNRDISETVSQIDLKLAKHLPGDVS